MLLQKGVDAGHAGAHQVITAPRALAKPRGGSDQHRNRQQGYQSQAGILPGHHRDDSRDHYQVTEQVGDPGSKQFVQRVYVGGQSAHDAANRITIVISDLLMLELVIEFAAQVEHDVLADSDQEHNLEIGKNKPDELNAEIYQREQHDSHPEGAQKVFAES